MADAATPEYFETIEINERQYQKYSIDNSIYHIPVDEEEEDRVILQHRVFTELFDGRLFFPSVQPSRVLDCGYGQGAWAVAMAQTYPQCEITAVDIWPADLPDEPENLECEVWDLNDPLIPTYQAGHYDLIHSRCVAPGIKKARWRSYMREIVRLLKPGGWVQMWGRAYRGAMDTDRDLRVGRTLVEKMRSAGLRDIQHRMYRVPIGDWSTDEKEQRVGTLNIENIDAMLDSHALWAFTQRLGWTAEQVGWLTDRARQEARDPHLRLYMPLYVAWGRKR